MKIVRQLSQYTVANQNQQGADAKLHEMCNSVV